MFISIGEALAIWTILSALIFFFVLIPCRIVAGHADEAAGCR